MFVSENIADCEFVCAIACDVSAPRLNVTPLANAVVLTRSIHADTAAVINLFIIAIQPPYNSF